MAKYLISFLDYSPKRTNSNKRVQDQMPKKIACGDPNMDIPNTKEYETSVKTKNNHDD